MTNQKIDGVPRELLERLLTDACNENWSDLNELLHSPITCRCKRYGKGNPHWPCPVHASPTAQHQVEPTEEMKEAGCQAYMDADGMIGIMHRSSMGHAYQAMRALEKPAPVPVAIDDNVEFEKWWMSTPILRKQKIQIAQEAWFARAKLDEQTP